MTNPCPKQFRFYRTRLLRLVAPVVSLAPFVHAADVFKADNAGATNLGSSWSGGVVPTANDVAVFDSSVSSIVSTPADNAMFGYDPRYVSLPVATSWKGIRVNNAANGLTLNTYDGAVYAPNVLTLGSAGIDMSSAAPNTVFGLAKPTISLAAGTVQTWSVADNTKLLLQGGFTRGSGATLRINLGASGLGTIQVDDSTYAASGAIMPYATIVGGSDFAGVTAASGKRLIAAGATVMTYTQNPNTGAALANLGVPATSVVDVVNSNTTATSTAYRVSTNHFLAGIRFATANANGMDWTVDGTNTVRNINLGNGGILVGPAVGAHNVVFSGASQFRFSSNQDFFIHQNNTAGDLILNNPMNSAGAGVRLVKTGPGRLILTNNGNALSGVVTINEGTIQVGNGGATGVIAASTAGIVNHGILAFKRTDVFSVANAISGTGQLHQLGSGTLTLSGANTYTGNTTISDGGLTISSAGSLVFDVNDADNTRVSGTGAFVFDGTLKLDLSDVTVALESWNLINAATLATTTFGPTFSVVDKSGALTFTQLDDVWTSSDGVWRFVEATGTLTIPEPSTYAALAGVFVLAGAALRRRRQA